MSRRGIALALVAAAIPRLAWLTREALWYDELFSLQLSWGSWPDLWRGAVADHTNPPLFYALLKAWVALGGDAVAWVRLLPALLGTLAVVPIIRLGEAAGLPAKAIAAGVAVYAASPPLAFLANDARAYALLVLLSAWALAATAEALADADRVGIEGAVEPIAAARPPRPHASPLLRLALLNALLLHTHYFGALVLVVQLLLARRAPRPARRAIAGAVAIAGITFVPWALAVVQDLAATGDRLANVAWIPRPGLADAVAPITWLVGDGPLWPIRIVGAAVALLGVVVALATGRKDRGVRTLAVAALTPLALALIASWTLPQSVWQPRYLVVTSAPLVLLIGAGVAALAARTRVPWPGVAGVGLVALAATAAAQRGRWDWKPRWDALVAAVAARTPPSGPRTPVLTVEGYVTLPVGYYAAAAPQLAVRPLRALHEMPAEGGWLVWRVASFADPGRPRRAATDAGLAVAESLFVSARRETIVAYRLVPAR